MDNFTFAVIVSDIVMIVAFLALIVLDKPQPAGTGTIEPVKTGGKRSA